jgi:Hemerythrin HHE cation binding domain
MPTPPTLLNDDGTASIATALMMSHHGFRRDLARFSTALEQRELVASRAAALREEWQNFRATLHGHHEAEDHGVFPNLRGQDGSLATTIDKLSADHRRIDPLLERGDRAFVELGDSTEGAAAVVRELRALLDPHLALEEAELIPLLRGAKAFPPPATDAEADMYAQGFAWAMQCIAPDVLERVYEMLPESLLSRLPAARAAFQARCDRVWGPIRTGASRTPIPEA